MTTADKLRGLLEGATKGPWAVKEGLHATAGGILTKPDIFGPNGERVLCDLSEDDRRLIVAAVNLLPALAAVVEAARATELALSPATHYDAMMRLRSALSALDEAVRREVPDVN